MKKEKENEKKTNMMKKMRQNKKKTIRIRRIW